MACPAILTGDQFLFGVLSHVDCQARTIGSYGYGALADPGSSVSIALTGLLTIFIALFGFRMLLGPAPQTRDVVTDVIRVGLVLALATSWPAWRVIGYDLVLNGPVEVARTLGLSSGLPGSRNDLLARLQNADDGIVAVTMYGSGRLTGGVVGGSDLGDSPRGVALADPFALGFGRTSFLVGAIAPYAIIRIGAGILLALAPLVAGLALFGVTSGLFWGWMRGLVFCGIAAISQHLIQSVELAVLEPFLSDVLSVREAGTLAPSAPTELLVLTSAFALISLGLLYLCIRVAFFSGTFTRSWLPASLTPSPAYASGSANHSAFLSTTTIMPPSRAAIVANAVSSTMRREEQASGAGGSSRSTEAGSRVTAAASSTFANRERSNSDSLGSQFRRTRTRHSPASQKRDRPA